MSIQQQLQSTAGAKLNPLHLPKTPLYGEQTSGSPTLGWRLSPTPFLLNARQAEEIQRLGPVLWRFVKAVDGLYRKSGNGQLPAWIAALYDQGKPEHLLQFARLNRLKSQLPLVLRPDLLLTETGFTLCEIDAVPGGIGFTAALNHLYARSGFSVVQPSNTPIPAAFLAMLQACVPSLDEPVIAVVLSDESADYRAEMAWLVDTIREFYLHIHLLHPREIDLVRDRLVFRDQSGNDQPIDLIYRFFELFDLPNIPQIDLIQYAVKKKLVHCTPPFKPHVEEKLSLALLHHPVLAAYWREQLGETDFEWLQQMVPQGWILDPAPLPPQAVIPGLSRNGLPIQDFKQLTDASQKERELVLKPSGFSELGWGSRGVTIGHDHPASVWAERLQEALSAFGRTPYLLQRFEPSTIRPVEHVDLDTGAVTTFNARTRLCPYYFVQGDASVLSGILATHCPADKKLIHGMKDAVLAPCSIG